MSGHRLLVLGGARSGKSLYAEQRATQAGGGGVVHYVATGVRPEDAEWAARVVAHKARRPAHWTTTATTDIAEVLAAARPDAVLLVDCASLWLAAQLDDAGAWAPGADPEAVTARLGAASAALLAAWAACPAWVAMVSNEVGSGVVPATPAGRRYRDELGRLNAALSAAADEAVLLVAGRPLALGPPLRAAPPGQAPGAGRG